MYFTIKSLVYVPITTQHKITLLNIYFYFLILQVRFIMLYCLSLKILRYSYFVGISNNLVYFKQEPDYISAKQQLPN